MLFTDVVFLFYFLPAVLILHRLTVARAMGKAYPGLARAFIFIATLVFYGFKEPWWLVPFVICIAFDFAWANWLGRTENKTLRKWLLFASISQNLFVLFVFKYYPTLLHNAVRWFPSLSGVLPVLSQDGHSLPMPAGISFYTFESLSFVIDVYRREIKAPKNPLEFFGFIGMFPRFIAGPIVRYRDMVSQFTKFEGMQLERGLVTFALGFFLKVCLADSFGMFTPYAFQPQAPPGFLAAWLGVSAYAMQLYFDFSGYSLMAIGIGLALGFRFPDNFDRPYLATSLADFWRRWHISLGSWIRDYLFTPLALTFVRRSPALIYPVMFLTMVVFGAWHGPKMTFLAMGAWHGLFLCVERAGRIPQRLNRWQSHAWTLFLVLVGWVFFRSESLTQATGILRGMFIPGADAFRLATEPIRFNPISVAFCCFGVFYAFFWEARKTAVAWPRLGEISFARKAGASVMLGLALVWVFSAQVIPFLYFQF